MSKLITLGFLRNCTIKSLSFITINIAELVWNYCIELCFYVTKEHTLC